MKLLASALAMALLVVLAAGCGCGKSSEEQAEDVLRGQMGYKDGVQKIAAKGLGHVKGLLASKSQMTRMTAIQALGLLKDNKEATQLLIDLMNKNDFNESWAAILALGVQGPPEAKDILKKAAESPNPRFREAACAAIYEYGDKSLYPLLDKAANDPDTTVQSAAAIAKQRITAGR